MQAGRDSLKITNADLFSGSLVVPALMATLEIDAMTLLASLFLIPHERVMLDVQWTLFYEVQFYLIFGTWIHTRPTDGAKAV